MRTGRVATAGEEGGPGWPALVLSLVLGWWTVRLGAGLADACFLDLVNLAFHEAGHLLLAPLGSTLHYLGGTLAQWAVPAGLAVHFLFRRGQPLGAAFCCWWSGESLINVSVYMADARSLDLPLVGGGDHDWNELFFRFGVLDQPSVERISASVRLLGVALMLAGLAWVACFALGDTRRRRLRQWLSVRWPIFAPLLAD